jgi:hypothetical protein
MTGSVIYPDLKKTVAKRLLDDDVDVTVVVNIQRDYLYRWLGRFKRDLSVGALGEMKLDLMKPAPTASPARKYGSIRLVITVEIGNGEGRTEKRAESSWRGEIDPRQSTYSAVLRTERWRC